MALLTEQSSLLMDICLDFTELGKMKELRSKKHEKYTKGAKLKKTKILQKLLYIYIYERKMLSLSGLLLCKVSK